MNLVIDLDICLFLPKCHTGQALSLFGLLLKIHCWNTLCHMVKGSGHS